MIFFVDAAGIDNLSVKYVELVIIVFDQLFATSSLLLNNALSYYVFLPLKNLFVVWIWLFDCQVSLTEFRFQFAEICQRCSIWRIPVVCVHALIAALIFQIFTGEFVINNYI